LHRFLAFQSARRGSSELQTTFIIWLKTILPPEERMAAQTNRQFRLKQRPVGRARSTDFDFVEAPIPTARAGEAIVQTLCLSIDPTNGIWMSDMEQYMPPVALGEVMRGGGIGRVVASNSGRWQVGYVVGGLLGWQEYCLVREGDIVRPAQAA
jgi:NADPH-dependent curcumin reductase CurA